MWHTDDYMSLTVEVILDMLYYTCHTVLVILYETYCMSHTLSDCMSRSVSHCMSHIVSDCMSHIVSDCMNHTVCVILYECCIRP